MTKLQMRYMAQWIELTRILERNPELRVDMRDIVKSSDDDWIDRVYPQPKFDDPLAT